MQFLHIIVSVLLARCVSKNQGEDGYEGFPESGTSVVVVGHEFFEIVEFLGAGPKKRAYRARRLKERPQRFDTQEYTIPLDLGSSVTDRLIPDEVVVKCSATDQPKRINKLEGEFKALTFLNRIQSVRKPVGLYLSKQWKCFDDSDFICQYMVMTMASLDIQKLIRQNMLGLRPPIVEGFAPKALHGIMSFELFIASFGLCLMAELEKLHAVGLVHRDVSIKNVALDPSDKTLVYLIDLGSSSFLVKYADSIPKVESLVKHDFDRVKRVCLQLIALAAAEAYEGVDDSHNDLLRIIAATRSQWELRITLLSFLKLNFPSVQFDGRIIYQ